MTPEQNDAVVRARTEVRLFLSKYERRLKTRAVEIALELLAKNPEEDPDLVGKKAAARAGKELKLLTRAAQTALFLEED